MKKILSFMMIIAIMFCMLSPVLAADEYSFDLQYTGNIVKNVEKDAVVLLTGVGGTLHTSVQIKVEITGPATPKILATDTTGVEHDIAQTGYWGPVSGFAVQGDFVNKTPIKATFVEEGNYSIKLSLIDLANANAVITTKTFDLQVYEDTVPENNVVDNTVVENNMIEELPKTGTSIWEYVAYVAILTVVLWVFGMYLNKRKFA